MTDVPLFPGYSEGTIQWRAQRLQVVNWGGFHGVHTLEFADGCTLLSGGSGSGKSTLLDAYIALMMPSTVPFNGASNDATTGRARGADQRNVLTYLRGKLDSAREGDGTKDRVLRGDGEPTWGAIAVTFHDERDREFTALRAYYVPASARRSADVTMRMFTGDHAVDAAQLEEFAASKFAPSGVKSALGLSHHDTVEKFTDTVTTRLGIGAGGEGDKALSLLARIQAGHQVKTVDSLYKQMVLETPRTFSVAKKAVAQFSSLNQAYQDMEEDAERERILRPISGLYAEYEEAVARADRLDSLGVAQESSAPFDAWQFAREEELLRAAISHVSDEERTARETLAEATRLSTTLAADVKDIEQQQRDNGGGALEGVTARLDAAVAARDLVQANVDRFVRDTSSLGDVVSTAQTFQAAKDAAQAFVGSADDEEMGLRKQRDDLLTQKPGLTRSLGKVRAELESLERRAGRVPVQYDEARRLIASACDVDPADLPFAAELMDVAPGQEDWRVAAEVTLRGVGLTMLMDARRASHIRSTIDSVPLRQRISFEAVDLTQDAPTPSDPDYISGKLTFLDSPFASWVKARVAAEGTDHLAVDDAADLGGERPKVTQAGQTSRGSRGAHGFNPKKIGILGYSGEERIAQLNDRGRELVAAIEDVDRQCHALEEQVRDVRKLTAQHRLVLQASWESLDLARVESDVERLSAEKEHLLADSDVLGVLQAQHAEVSAAWHDAQERLFAASGDVKRLESLTDELKARRSRVRSHTKALADAGVEAPSGTNATLVDELLREVRPQVTHSDFADAAAQVRRELRQHLGRERDAAGRISDQLETVFERYNERWPDPNRGSTIAAYSEFAQLHEEIVSHGLFERRAAFRQHFQKWSGNDLKLLSDAFDVALSDIEERLDPVNEILSELPFGAMEDRLKIVLRRVPSDAVTEFRRRLRAVSSGPVGEWNEEEAAARFKELHDLMAVLAASDAGSSPQRDALLDVRGHIEVSASRLNAEGVEVSTYSALGGKSGGESQELVAFIVGAALRYQLGDETRTRPRFAPVFLDEGFVKSDAEFAGRAVQAWRGLGFQLIVGAPLDKVSALEPHMDIGVAITKNNETGYSFIDHFVDVPTAD